MSCGPGCCFVSDGRALSSITFEMIREHVLKHAETQDCSCDACARTCACGRTVRAGQGQQCVDCQMRGALR
jgi:hypothetical protein